MQRLTNITTPEMFDNLLDEERLPRLLLGVRGGLDWVLVYGVVAIGAAVAWPPLVCWHPTKPSAT